MSPPTSAPLRRPATSTRTPESLLRGLARGSRTGRLTHVHRVPAREASPAPFPDWVTPTLYAALTQSGVGELWSHQREAADAAHAGEHVVLSTGTASGKSLGYLLPVVVSGSIVVSLVLSLPTVGPLLLRSLIAQDMFLAGTIVLLLGVMTVIGTFLSDLMLMWIDPRIRAGMHG